MKESDAWTKLNKIWKDLKKLSDKKCLYVQLMPQTDLLKDRKSYRLSSTLNTGFYIARSPGRIMVKRLVFIHSKEKV